MPILNTQFGNVLLVSGAQISLICCKTADIVELKGKDILINITKVGREQTITMKVYKVPVATINDQKKHSVNAIGIPCIPECLGRSSDMTKDWSTS